MPMEIKINSLIKGSHHLKCVEVFGYTSKGTPGLDVTGLNGKSRQFKEKMIFLSKRRRLHFPLKRYVICLESEDISKYEIEWLELPMLLAFWSLSSCLPLKRLDNCFASAKVSLEGKLDFLDIDQEEMINHNSTTSFFDKGVVCIGDETKQDFRAANYIDALELLNDNIGHFYR